MKLKPWYKVVTPREDLREGKPLDAAQFAVHLDRVQDGTATKEYTDPKEFFARTFLTQNLLDLSTQVVRRMNGIKTETSAVFNLATQFGGGKTHALTLLYHMAKHGSRAKKWAGVNRIMENGGVDDLPEANIAIFVGTEFDSITGRGGEDGSPHRTTPWGEIAYQIGGKAGFDIVAEHDQKKEAPAGDTIRKFIDPEKPTLILLDELMSWIGRNIKSGLASQFYNFLQSLTSTATGMGNVVLVVSVPASEMEMSTDEVQEYDRITKWLNREGKAIVMNAETEASEIIRRRLFEWNPDAITGDGRVILDKDACATCAEYASWISDNASQIPQWFSPDHARKEFESTFPFHPSVISVFLRKWRGIPKFQQTRGVLRLLALWVSQAYEKGFKGDHKDHLIGLGTAPIGNSLFRSACFEELNERNLEVAVVTDIAGQPTSHAVRLDVESTDEIKKARLHQKVATSIFFESNGGQLKGKEATIPEIRMAVGDPGLDIGNVETTLDALIDACYYLQVERNQYAFGLKENLNKRYSDHRANIGKKAIDEVVEKEVRRLFVTKEKCGVVFFPEKSIQISDHPALTFAIANIDQNFEEKAEVMEFMDKMTKGSGTSNRTCKSAIVWCVADSAKTMREESARMLAWQDIDNMAMSLNLDDAQKQQLSGNIKRAKASLTEAIWRAYKHVVLLGKDNDLREIDLGLITSSSASSPLELVLRRLIGEDVVTKSVVPRVLARNWPPAFTEWSTKSVRDAFFSAPQLPKLLNPDSLRDTIARGVSRGELGYVGKTSDGKYKPFHFNTPLDASDVEISEDMYIVTEETAKAYETSQAATPSEPQTAGQPEGVGEGDVPEPAPTTQGDFIKETPSETGSGTIQEAATARSMNWSGTVPPLKWMNFYTKIVSKHATDKGLSLRVELKIESEEGISQQKIAETKAALRDLGLDPDVEVGE